MGQTDADWPGDARGDRGDDVQEIGVIVLPGFALLSFASACEPFRAANRLAGRALYRLRYFAETTGGRVASSSGVEVPTEDLPRERGGLDMVFVCAGGEPAEWHRPAIHAALRRLARLGVRIGGISGGPYILAAAGLLDDHPFTIHWEHVGALSETLPDLNPAHARYVIAGGRMTCGGGIAPLDMMHALIADRMGEAFAGRVSDWFLHTAVGAPADAQRASPAERFGVHHPALLRVIETMESTVEAPLSRRAMAALASVSERHLDRLFRDKLGRSFSDQYRTTRLAHAQRLLRQSPLTVSEIAAATGFSGASHFSRSYRNQFGRSATAERRTAPGPPVTSDAGSAANAARSEHPSREWTGTPLSEGK